MTGDLEVATWVQEGWLVVSVRYAGAKDWYTVSGSPAEITQLTSASGERSHEALHRDAMAALTTPGAVRGGNEKPTDLHRLSGDTTD